MSAFDIWHLASCLDKLSFDEEDRQQIRDRLSMLALGEVERLEKVADELAHPKPQEAPQVAPQARNSVPTAQTVGQVIQGGMQGGDERLTKCPRCGLDARYVPNGKFGPFWVCAHGCRRDKDGKELLWDGTKTKQWYAIHLENHPRESIPF